MKSKKRKMAADLSRLKFQGMLLDKSDFSRSKLIQSDLSRAVLWDSRVNDADLRQAKLTGADMRNTSFIDSDLREANLDGARMDSVDANHANFGQASLVNASLISANLRHCLLDDADFAGADLTNADLEFATGYTVSQLGAARSLYRTAGIVPAVAAELHRSHPHLFAPPPGAESAEYRVAARPASRPSLFQTVASLFARPLP